MQFDIFNGTAASALSARAALAQIARSGAVDEPRMGKIAQAAIFNEALLSALHARISEFRVVTK